MNPVSWLVDRTLHGLGFDPRTVRLVKFELIRLRTRVLRKISRAAPPEAERLQLGAGRRAVAGWANSDVIGSDYDVDLGAYPLPFPSARYTDIVSQHTIEHLEFDPQVIELFKESYRILKPGGKVWFTCPDLAKICQAYIDDGCKKLDHGLMRHWPHANADNFPVQHRVNYYFHQGGEHRNIMDFAMLKWALEYAGFVDVAHREEQDLLDCYPGFPPRNDDFESLYVVARKPDPVPSAFP